jgi:hypothetical protein
MLNAQIKEEIFNWVKLIGSRINNPNDVLLVLQIIRAAFFFSTAALYFGKSSFAKILVNLIWGGMREEMKFLSSNVREREELSRKGSIWSGG